MKRLGGWWRLWIVGSVLWGITVFSLFAASWPSSWDQHKLDNEEMKLLSSATQGLIFAQHNEKGVDSSDPLDGLVDGKTQSGSKKQIFIDDVPRSKPSKSSAGVDFRPITPEHGPWEDYATPLVQLTSGQEITLKPHTSQEQINSVRQDFARVQQTLMWRDRRRDMLAGFWIWSIPCLSVLALAQAGRWVVVGFRKQPAPAAVVIPPEQNTDSRA